MLKRMLLVLAGAALGAVLLTPLCHAEMNTAVLDEIRTLEKLKGVPVPHEEKVRLFRLSNGQQVSTLDWNIVLFMASDCSYCKRFDPVLKKVSEDTGVDVFPYSLNGEADAAFPNAVPAPPAVVAAFFAQGLPVATPTTFLVNVNTMDTFPLLQGDATEAQITDRLDTVFIEALKRMSLLPGGAS